MPIDPADIGRSYEAGIRVNSQSGKGGVAYLLEQDYGLVLPRGLQVEFSKIVQKITDTSEKELSSQQIYAAFEKEYLVSEGGKLADPRVDISTKGDERLLTASVVIDGRARRISGSGNGPISAFMDALSKECGLSADVIEYSEHSVGKGSKAQAIAYVEVSMEGLKRWGVGRHESILAASVSAVLSAISRIQAIRDSGIEPSPSMRVSALN